MKLVLFLLLVSTYAFAAPGDDLAKAPPSFAHLGSRAVFVDFQTMDLRLTVDIPNNKATGEVTLQFYSTEAGFPILDLLADPSRVALNGSVTEAPLVDDPDHVTHFRVLAAQVTAHSLNTLTMTYAIPSTQIKFSPQGVELGFYTSDLDDRKFLEQYAPSSFEYDHWRLHLELELMGASKPHRFFANGDTKKISANRWVVDFPDYFTASSFFLVLSESDLDVLQGTYAGLERSIPVTVFTVHGSTETVQKLMAQTLDDLQELENKLGPYSHEQLIVDGDGGGMEYCGAVQADLYSLKHELNHQWFARGVMSANGNSGWIDEALVTWISGPVPWAASGKLSGYSPYARETPLSAYYWGSRFFSKLDGLLSSRGGLLPIVRDLFAKKNRQAITTEELEAFIEASSGMDFRSLFKEDVYTNLNLESLTKSRIMLRTSRGENAAFQ